MEPPNALNLDERDLGLVKAEGDVAQVDEFNETIKDLWQRVNTIEEQLKEVEQFYLNMDEIQPNTSKSRLIVKEKVKERHITSIEKLQQEALHREEAAGRRMQELKRQFATIFHQITRHKGVALPFMYPVDVEALGLHDYYEVIDKPMDFSTIKNKMEGKDGVCYKNVREIYADVRLVFKNAMKYNDERDDVHVMAKSLLEKFEEKWLQLLPKVVEEEKRQQEEEAKAQLDMQATREVVHANRARDLFSELHEVETQLEQLRETVVRNGRKTSIEEKKKLMTALTRLSLEDLTKALDIVAENNPSFQAGSQEVDIDMDAQSEVTLWRLKAFVKEALKAAGRVPGDMGGNNNNNNANNDNDNNSNKKNKNNSKRRREMCDALIKTSLKRTKKVSPNT